MKTHSQTLGGAQRTLQMRGGRIVGVTGVEGTRKTKTKNQLSRPHRDSQAEVVTTEPEWVCSRFSTYMFCCLA
jgi:ABC-type sugar transport system ATPase subunit